MKLAVLFLELSDWNAVREEVLSENLLQARTISTLKRVCREIVSRLKTLDPNEIDLLVNGCAQEQGYLLWIAVCRRYEFIADFAIEVVRERFISLKNNLGHEDFDSFFNRKSEWHPELDEIQPMTRKKLRQVLFRIMRDAKLLVDNNVINEAILSPLLLRVIHSERRQDILFFPAFQSDQKLRKDDILY